MTFSALKLWERASPVFQAEEQRVAQETSVNSLSWQATGMTHSRRKCPARVGIEA